MTDQTKRTFSIYHLVATAGVLAIVIFGIYINGSLLWFVNIPSALTVIGITFFLLLGNFGADFLKFIPDSFLTFFSKPVKPIPRYAEIAQFGSRYSVGAGILGTLIGLIQMFFQMDDPSSLGPALGIALLTIFYALFLSEIYFAFLYKAYTDGETHNNKPLSMKPTILSFLVLSIIFINLFISIIGMM